MTLCVAAQCAYKGQDQVVVAVDLSMESGIATAEIEHRKIRWIGQEQFPVLISGEYTRCVELIAHIEHIWDSRKDRTEEQAFLPSCRLAVRKHKHTLANEYVSARLGMSYDNFLGPMRASIPDTQYREIMADIERMKTGCELLILYFEPEESTLIRIDDSGKLEICSNFAAIGSGMYIAESALFQREHSRGDALADSIYHVYEAMRLGAYAPGVGTQFVMGIVQFPRQVLWTFLEPQYLRALGQDFKKFGPKKLAKRTLHHKFLKKLYRITNDPKDDGTVPE
jgi:20S proteasome alpha/beta subunit